MNDINGDDLKDVNFEILPFGYNNNVFRLSTKQTAPTHRTMWDSTHQEQGELWKVFADYDCSQELQRDLLSVGTKKL